MKRKNKHIKDIAIKVLDLSIWLAILGFGLYLGIKLIIGLTYHVSDDVLYYGFALTGYVAAIIMIVIGCIFMSMIIKEWKKGDDEE